MVPVAALNTATGIASESYAARSGPQTRSTANPTFPPTAVFVLCVSTAMDPRLPATRTGSRTSEEPVAAFVVAHPASAKQQMIVVARIVAW
jgi:hypothetical protein